MEATDLADYLVYKGVPFRDAHHIVGETVRYCIGVGKTLTALSLDEFRRFCPEVEEDVFDALQIETILARRGHSPCTGTCRPGRGKKSAGGYLVWIRIKHASEGRIFCSVDGRRIFFEGICFFCHAPRLVACRLW